VVAAPRGAKAARGGIEPSGGGLGRPGGDRRRLKAEARRLVLVAGGPASARGAGVEAGEPIQKSLVVVAGSSVWASARATEPIGWQPPQGRGPASDMDGGGTCHRRMDTGGRRWQRRKAVEAVGRVSVWRWR
jgi:hypothetical protein